MRALGNGRKALETLRAMSAAEWDHLFELVCHDGLAKALQQRHPDVLELFEAVKGDDEALARLQRKRPAYARLAATGCNWSLYRARQACREGLS